MRLQAFVLGALVYVGCSSCRSGEGMADHSPSRKCEGAATRSGAVLYHLVGSISAVDNRQDLLIDNSGIVVGSAGVDRVVAEGLAAVPYLLEQMQRRDLDFDTFVRSWSATERILQSAGSNVQVPWWGGASTYMDREGVERIAPGMRDDMWEGRQDVVLALRKAYLECINGAQ